MATISFSKNVVISEPQAIDKLVVSLNSNKTKYINKDIASDENLKRSEKLLKHCLRSKQF